MSGADIIKYLWYKCSRKEVTPCLSTANAVERFVSKSSAGVGVLHRTMIITFVENVGSRFMTLFCLSGGTITKEGRSVMWEVIQEAMDTPKAILPHRLKVPE